MSEFRQDPVTREWVIVVPERARRPHQHAQGTAAACPFCPGSEGVAGTAVTQIDDGSGGWFVRVIENRFPILDREVVQPRSGRAATWRRLPGSGRHEIVIDSPKHTATLGTLDANQIRRLLGVYIDRIRALALVDGIREIVVFRNHGAQAGASLRHPHSQIIATPVISPVTRRRIMDEIAFFDDYGECALCRALEDERAARSRLVHESRSFVTYAPFASRTSHQMRIVPRRHCPRFEEIEPDELDDLASHLQRVFAALETELDNPDQNLVIASPPLDLVHRSASHWFIDVLPRLAIPAGFEIGSGIAVTTCAPEAAAAGLRRHVVPAQECA